MITYSYTIKATRETHHKLQTILKEIKGIEIISSYETRWQMDNLIESCEHMIALIKQKKEEIE